MIKKISSFVIALWFVLTVTFILMKLIPGDPFNDEQMLPEKVLTELKSHYGLDKPIFFQYINYIIGFVRLDLGPSLQYHGREVSKIIIDTFPLSFLLGTIALSFAISFGILLGYVSAMFKASWINKFAFIIIIFLIALPNFCLATFLQYTFAIKLKLFPTARFDSIWHAILPALALSALPAAFIAALIRSKSVDILHAPFIKTARAKGLSQSALFFRHILPNTFLPVIGYLGQLSANILVGSFVIEKIFSIPGLGSWFVMSIFARDYPVILGLTAFYSTLLLAMIFLSDLAMLYLDPRLKRVIA